MEADRLSLEDLPLPAVILDGRPPEVVAANAQARRLGLGDGGSRLVPVPPDSRDFDGLCRLRHADGRDTVVEAKTSALSGDRRLVVLRTIDESTPPSRELTRLEASFRALADQVPGAVFRYRLHPDGTDSVVYMSKGCFELWEVEAEAIRNDATLLWQVVHPDDLPQMQASVMASAERLSAWRHEWRITTPSGKKKWLSAVGRPHREPDGTVEWNTLITDVTERHVAEQQRQELEEELRRADRMRSLGRLAGSIAHDFNNMLTVIQTCGESAVEDVRTRPDEAEVLVRDMLAATERASDLTRNLLTFARGEDRSVRTVDLLEHVRKLETILSRLVGRKGRFELSPRCAHAPVLIDPSEIDQILTNLVVNARDARPEGVTVSVTVRSTAEVAELWVEDDGPGIPEEIRDQVFDPFFSTKGRASGNSGLGLAAVHAITLRRGGTVELDRPGQGGSGTRFVFRFPTPTHASLGTGDLPSATGSTPPLARVLLVDAEPQGRLALGRLLHLQGFQAVAVASVGEALDALRDAAEPFDVLIVDEGLSAEAEPLLRASDLEPLWLMSCETYDPQRGHLGWPTTAERLRRAVAGRLARRRADAPSASASSNG